MLLPLAQSWPVRCTRCGHTGTVSAATADLARKQLRCGCCGTRQAFAPESVVRAPRRPNGRLVREQRRAAKAMTMLATTDAMPNDRLDDIAWAG